VGAALHSKSSKLRHGTADRSKLYCASRKARCWSAAHSQPDVLRDIADTFYINFHLRIESA